VPAQVSKIGQFKHREKSGWTFIARAITESREGISESQTSPVIRPAKLSRRKLKATGGSVCSPFFLLHDEDTPAFQSLRSGRLGCIVTGITASPGTPVYKSLRGGGPWNGWW
jgi:hypothetical protein